ncbi:hypothetical protein QZM48_02185 [Burkholderia orbicola]|nr:MULTISPECIES: hypothetical protein [Burkholderia cepacia complex]MCA8416025.1 hypothetical protein [Burkholderia cenocepacia]MDN7480060.1 hypothetical protein [Burkholderia orbicola]MDN7528761.1 hypothetical protein [Burkholderia orbicola]MDN7728809.1 hypothetical protein [Burkholderia orbicola]MDN7773750.1 hypothetical protein [Burkholderia orbicola]
MKPTKLHFRRQQSRVLRFRRLKKAFEPMQKKFLMRGYEMNCEPRVTETGKYAAQVEVTKVGFSREAAFRKLGEFDTEAEAVAYARQFSEEWLSRYA